MNVCPLCGSKAVVARTCLSGDFVQSVQEGTDPYDLLFGAGSRAECRICGHIFVPAAETEDHSASGREDHGRLPGETLQVEKSSRDH